jgi:hypothetical protein
MVRSMQVGLCAIINCSCVISFSCINLDENSHMQIGDLLVTNPEPFENE